MAKDKDVSPPKQGQLATISKWLEAVGHHKDPPKQVGHHKQMVRKWGC